MNDKLPPSKNTITDSNIHAGRDVHIGDKITYNNYVQEQTVSIPRRLTNNIPSNAEHILGRTDELAAIADHLANNHATVLVNGIGGMGKTSVATKYMVQQRNHYTHFAWLTVSGSLVDTFINNTELIDSLLIKQNIKDLVEAKNSAGAFSFLFKKLNDLDETLVVIDNANDLADLLEYKQLFDTATCHILITSRSRPPEWATVPVEALPEAEAVKVFLKLNPAAQAHIEAIKNLLPKLYYHTLLIELVAKAVASAGLSFEELETMIDTKFIHHEDLQEEWISTGAHGESVQEHAKRANIENYIWLIFNQVLSLDDTSKTLLKTMALLPLAMTIERDHLKGYCAFFNLKNIVPTLTILTERGWLDREQAIGQKPHYKIHPLIVDVVVKHLAVNVTFAEPFINKVAERIHYDNTSPDFNLFEIIEFRPFAERLKDLFFNENTEGVSYLLDRLGYLDENFGLYQKAAKVKERALQIAESVFDENHEMIAVLQNNLANVYRKLGEYTRAFDLLELALASDIKNLGQDHPNIAVKQANLANVYRNLGEYAKACDLLEVALASELKYYEPDSSSVATIQANLGAVYSDLGDYNRARDLLELALSSDLKNFGQDHPVIAVRQSNLANVYSNLGDNVLASDLLEAALASDIKNFGREHPNIAVRQNNLAWVYKRMGQDAEAKVLWQAAYDNYLKNLGATHPHTVLFKEKAEM
jgi:tetratricopeptide (TPR) repeat protein